MSGHRSRRVADQVKRALARVLQEELRDPRVGFVTLTEVRMSPDLRVATVYVSSAPDHREQSLAGLEAASSFLRRAVAREAGLRYAPELRFLYDETFERSQRLEDLFREMHDGDDA